MGLRWSWFYIISGLDFVGIMAEVSLKEGFGALSPNWGTPIHKGREIYLIDSPMCLVDQMCSALLGGTEGIINVKNKNLFLLQLKSVVKLPLTLRAKQGQILGTCPCSSTVLTEVLRSIQWTCLFPIHCCKVKCRLFQVHRIIWVVLLGCVKTLF